MKKIFLIIIALAVIGGGIYYFIKNKEPKEKNLEDVVSERIQERGSRFEGLPEGTLEDLVIGEEIMVMGAENQDGSITAEMIFIGTAEGMPEFSSDMHIDSSNRSMPEGMDEERMELMQEMRANAGSNFRVMNGSMMADNTAFIRGEIIDKDEMSITVKLVDSGSKLIFYSNDTEIRIQE